MAASAADHGLLVTEVTDRSYSLAFSIPFIPPWAIRRVDGEVDLDYNDLEVELIFGGTR